MTELDRKSLAEELDLPIEDVPIETFREVLNKAKEVPNPDNVLSTVIEKAGVFLDMVERESVNGNMSARMMEVGNQILNTLITATNSMVDNYSKNFNDEMKQVRLKQRDRELDQKDKELEIKEYFYKQKLQLENGQQSNTTNNILVTDRESLLKYLNQGGNPKELEQGE